MSDVGDIELDGEFRCDGNIQSRVGDVDLNTSVSKEEYNYNLQYGVWQIDTDININWKDENDNRIYKYPELNGHIATLKVKLKKYYKDNICNSLFKYELIK